MKRKVISLFIALFTVLMTLVPATAATTSNGYYLYRDVSTSHWAYNYIVYATQYGLVTGFNDGTFVPDGALTEAQCCQIVYNCLDYGNYGNGYGYNYGGSYNSNYNNGYWYSEAVNFVERNSNLRISPNQTATRSFVCILIYSFTNVSNRFYADNGSYYGYNNGGYNNYGYNTGYNYNYYYTRFSDCYNLPTATQEAISWCQANGIVNGFQDGTFRPYDTLTRAQGAKVFVVTYQQFWQYGYNGNGGSYYYTDPATGILNYATELGITAEVQDNSNRNEYRQTLVIYGRNSQKYTYTYRNNQWYDSNGYATNENNIRAWISNLESSMTQREKAGVACSVAAEYAKNQGYKIISLGEWPSYDKNSGVYWHRLQISNNRTEITFLVGGDTRRKEANWFTIEANSFRVVDGGYTGAKNIIASWNWR